MIFGFAAGMLHQLIKANDWSAVASRCDSHPAEARKYALIPALQDGFHRDRGLALHHAICEKAPDHVILKILECHPQALQKKTSRSCRLPLHVACLFASSTDVTMALMRRFPDALGVTDVYHRVPLHYSLSNRQDVEVHEAFLDVNDLVCRRRDFRGWSVLHMAVASGSPLSLVRRIVELYPKALRAGDQNGYIPRDFGRFFIHTRQDVMEYMITATPLLGRRVADPRVLAANIIPTPKDNDNDDDSREHDVATSTTVEEEMGPGNNNDNNNSTQAVFDSTSAKKTVNGKVPSLDLQSGAEQEEPSLVGDETMPLLISEETNGEPPLAVAIELDPRRFRPELWSTFHP